MRDVVSNLTLQRLLYPRERDALQKQLALALEPDPKVVGVVEEMAGEIRARGDAAVAEYTQRFDGVDLAGRLRVTPDEIAASVEQVAPEVLDAIRLAHERLVAFHERCRPQTWTYKEQDSELGQLVRPIERVGVYAPGGTAAYVSTVLMDVVPAQVAGCPEIVLCSSPKAELGGAITPVILAACHILGINEVYRVAGAQGILALALGTEQVAPVDMICGPGNTWVTEAKRYAQGTGRVKIDKLAGPTEVLIIADKSADPVLIAADLLAQAEHDPAARPLLVTDDEGLVPLVEEALRAQLTQLSREDIALQSLTENGYAVIVSSLTEACEVSNLIAPEHLELLVADPDPLIDRIQHAGALFVGPYAPEALGDYVAGPNHVLPTVATARFSSPLLVDDFVKVTSLLRIGPETFEQLAEASIVLAEAEGLTAHAESVRKRRAQHKG